MEPVRKGDRSPSAVLSLARCREILGPLAEGRTDAEIEQAREAALELARMILELLTKERAD